MTAPARLADRARLSFGPARGGDAVATTQAGPWVLAFEPRSSDPTARAQVTAALAHARVARFGWLVLQTCRRVELMGAGPRPLPATLATLTGVAAAADARELAGMDAARHVLRLAAGLESSVIGEDQVLAQVRRLRRSADSTLQVDGRLVGLLDVAIHLGVTARRERPRLELSLAERGLGWLRANAGPLAGERLLVVGSGPIGREAARLARQAGATLTVAVRNADARPRDAGPCIALAAAAHDLGGYAAVVVALAGPWSDLLDADLEGRTDRRPYIVDLSDPSAIPGPVRARLGGHLATLDSLTRSHARSDAVTSAYVRYAEDLVEQSLARLARRSDPGVGAAIQAQRTEAEAHRRRELEQLWRRLPDLDPHVRTAIERFSRSLAGGLLHAPTLALRDGPAARIDGP